MKSTNVQSCFGTTRFFGLASKLTEIATQAHIRKIKSELAKKVVTLKTLDPKWVKLESDVYNLQAKQRFADQASNACMKR